MRIRSAVVAGLALLTACGGGTTKTAAPTTSVSTPAITAPTTTAVPAVTTTVVDYPALQQQYLTAVGPANAALATFETKAKALPASATAAQLEKLAEPLIASYRVADSALLAIGGPPQLTADIRTLVTADGAQEGDLSVLGGANALTADTLIAAWVVDANKAHTAATIVRSDLHLPANNA